LLEAVNHVLEAVTEEATVLRLTKADGMDQDLKYTVAIEQDNLEVYFRIRRHRSARTPAVVPLRRRRPTWGTGVAALEHSQAEFVGSHVLEM
jgi:hypothetical protein